MKPDEQIVYVHLQRRNFGKIEYEPLGNVPPDFLVNGRIAVEARRLNQHDSGQDEKEGLESVDFGLAQTIRRVLQELGPSTSGNQWYLSYDFRRPVPPKAEVITGLHRLLSRSDDEIRRFERGCLAVSNVWIRLLPTPTPLAQRFELGAILDLDAGGWKISEYRRNVAICIDEKTRKLASCWHLFPEWWLALVDHVGFGLDHDDLKQLRETPISTKPWSDVLLISPRNPERWVSLTQLWFERRGRDRT